MNEGPPASDIAGAAVADAAQTKEKLMILSHGRSETAWSRTSR
jgi:hypothetical protein